MELTKQEKEMIEIMRKVDVSPVKALYSILEGLDYEVNRDMRSWGKNSWQVREAREKRDKFYDLLK